MKHFYYFNFYLELFMLTNYIWEWSVLIFLVPISGYPDSAYSETRLYYRERKIKVNHILET